MRAGFRSLLGHALIAVALGSLLLERGSPHQCADAHSHQTQHTELSSSGCALCDLLTTAYEASAMTGLKAIQRLPSEQAVNLAFFIPPSADLDRPSRGPPQV